MNKIGYSVFFMFAITLLCTTLVSVIHVVTRERIDLNQHAKLEIVVLRALAVRIPENSSLAEIDALFRQRVARREISGRTVYIIDQADGKTPQGYAFSVSGPGFWGPVFAMVAVDASLSTVTGIEFYLHRETPGLGARINEKEFQRQFAGLSLNMPVAGGKYFTLTPAAPGKPPSDLDAITGATMTSEAVEKFVNREIATLRALLLENSLTTVPKQ